METLFVFRAEGIGGHRLIALHKAHHHIAADEDQPLDNAAGGDDQVGIRQGLCGNIGQRRGHGKADLDHRRGDADGCHAPQKAAAEPETAGHKLDDGTPAQVPGSGS